jgi:hypothetical protein
MEGLGDTRGWRLAGLLPKRREFAERSVLLVGWHVLWNDNPRQRAFDPKVRHWAEAPWLVKSAGLQYSYGRHTLNRPP